MNFFIDKIASGNLSGFSGYAGDPSLATVGTITAGLWRGTAIETKYGGLGADNSGATGVPVLVAGVVTVVAAGVAGQVFKSGGPNAVGAYANDLGTIGFGQKGGTITTGRLGSFRTMDFAGTLTGWSISADTGTATVKFWKVATGTAVPTSGENINSSGVSLSTGTNVKSSTVSDFTTTAFAIGDIVACNIEAITGSPTEIAVQLYFTKS